jgi:DNA mismatch repair ATPase MutS
MKQKAHKQQKHQRWLEIRQLALTGEEQKQALNILEAVPTSTSNPHRIKARNTQRRKIRNMLRNITNTPEAKQLLSDAKNSRDLRQLKSLVLEAQKIKDKILQNTEKITKSKPISDKELGQFLARMFMASEYDAEFDDFH